MPDIRIGSIATAISVNPSWDTVWVGDEVSLGGYGDWAITEKGSLAASSSIVSAIMICLFTDRRLPSEMTAVGDYDQRGWHGDHFDVDGAAGEREIGSLLWTLDRASLSPETARRAEYFARDALQTLVDQRAVGRFDIDAEVASERSSLILHIVAYAPESDTPTARQSLTIL